MKFHIKEKTGLIEYLPESGVVIYKMPEMDKTAMSGIRKELIEHGYRCWCGRKMLSSDDKAQWQVMYQAIIHTPFPPALHLRYMCPDCFEAHKKVDMRLQGKRSVPAVKFKFKLRRR